MFEGIKIISTFAYVRGLVPKGWTNITESVLTTKSFEKEILIFENYFFIENCFLWRHQRLHSNN